MIGLALILCLVLIVVLIVVLTRLAEIASQVRILEERLRRLSQEFQESRPPVEAMAPLRQSVETRVAEEPQEVPAPAPAFIEERPSPPLQPAPPTPVFPPTPVPPSRTREEWEALIGGKLLNRIGALALVIGIGFFLKYAFDNNWLSETVRVLLGAAAGLLLLAGAARSRKHGLLIFAQGLVGAGIAVLYLSVYASFNYYSLVTQPIAFVLMAIVTVIAFTQAFFYDSIAVSFLGWIGGFLTPFMLSTGEANEIGLFSYIGLLAAGMIVVVMKKEKWAIIEPLTLAATYSIFYLWYGQEYKPVDLAPTLFFATIFWALFFVADVVNSARQVKVLVELRGIAAAFNGALFYIALYLLIEPDHHAWMGGTTGALGATYLVTALAMMQKRAISELNFLRFVLTSIILVALATAIEFTRFALIAYWSVEALVLVWCGRRWNLRFVLFSAFALYIVTTVALIFIPGAFFYEHIADFNPVFNMRTAAFALLAASMGGSALLLSQEVRNSPRGWTFPAKPAAVTALHYAWCCLLFILLTVEINDLYRLWMVPATVASGDVLAWQRYLIIAIAWAAYGLAVAWTGRRNNLTPLLVSGTLAVILAMGLALIRGLTFVPIEQFTLLLNLRALTFALVIMATLTLCIFLGKMKGVDQYFPVRSFLHYGWCLLLFILATVEVKDFFEQMIIGTSGADARLLAFQRYMTEGAIWALVGLALMWAARRWNLKPLLYSSIFLMILAMGMAAIRGIAFDPVERFDLVFNYRALVMLIITAAMFAVVPMLRKMKAMGWARESADVIGTFIVVLILVLLTGETRDFFEKRLEILVPPGGGVIYSTSDLENMKQLCLSGVWLLYSISLMGIGIWRRLRSLRIIAFVLFGITILKIFIYDLSFLETLYRIFSFIGLGVVLLVVSYLYQHYKDVIFQEQPEEEVATEETAR